jgi:response regulator of citrate/malate metabolism
MTYEQIKTQAAGHKGLEFSASEFRLAFGTGTQKLMNQLMKDGIIENAGEYPNNGRPCLKYRVK